MASLMRGSEGPEVERLQTELQKRGFNPGTLDGKFGGGTEAALIAFQNSEGLLADGKAGPKTLAALGFENVEPSGDLGAFTVEFASQLFPSASLDVLKTNLPLLLQALTERDLSTNEMVLMALATIRVEVGNFRPISEFVSRFNTSPTGGHSFDLYDNRKDLGNQGSPDGERYRGRGFVQLTGRANYTRYSTALGLGTRLVDEPDLANDPKIAAQLIARFIKDREKPIKEALLAGDFRMARRLINGGNHGLPEFEATYKRGEELLASAGQA